MFELFTSPRFPNAAIGLDDRFVASVALEKQGRNEFAIRQAAVIDLPEGVLTADFFEPNIVDTAAFMEALEDAVTASGLLKQKRWSVSLPGNAARTAILTLESEPASRAETEEILDWKAEQTFGSPAKEMRISLRRIAPDGEARSRFFAAAIRLAIIDEYETIFERFGWKAGLVMPRPVSEAAWLAREFVDQDSLLLSSQENGFTALLLRGGEPAVVRSVTCSPAEADDEVYRLLMFYNDRFAAGGGLLEKILVVGRGLLPVSVSAVASEAFGRAVRVLEAEDVGLSIPDSSLPFDSIAAPAGLASLA
jgi:hypothetical protein